MSVDRACSVSRLPADLFLFRYENQTMTFAEKHDRRRFRTGVTLIETIMVIMVLAMASVGGSLIFSGDWLEGRSTTDATYQIVQTMTEARNTAIMNQTNVNVRHLRSGGHERLQIIEEPGPIRVGKAWEIDLGETVAIDGSPAAIQFYPTGSCNQSLQWKLGSSRSTGIVLVNAINGQVDHKISK